MFLSLLRETALTLEHERVRKWVKERKLTSDKFDACAANYNGPDGLLARSTNRLYTSVEEIRTKLATLHCKDRDNHQKCYDTDSPYPLQISSMIIESYLKHCKQGKKCTTNSISMVAISTQASQLSASSLRLRLADAMTMPSEIPVVDVRDAEIDFDDAEERAHEFRLALNDPDRLADALAGLTKPAAFCDIAKFVREPKETDDPDKLFLRCIPNHEWLDLRKQNPYSRWTMLYELWHEERGVRVQDDRTATGPLVADASLEGWLTVLVDFLRDITILGFSHKASQVYEGTKMFDLCHRFTLLAEGLGEASSFPVKHTTAGRAVYPVLAAHSTAASRAILCHRRRRRAARWPLSQCKGKGSQPNAPLTTSSERRSRMTLEMRVPRSRCYGANGLSQILQRVDVILRKYMHQDRRPKGFDIYISWTGNDVYGKWGYKNFTWHHQSPWVKETAEMAKKAYEWPIKQLKQVQDDVQKLIALKDRPGIHSVTVITGPENGEFYNLPEEYDAEMTRHAKVLADAGIRLVDPNPLLGATDRPDGFHTSHTPENANRTVQWYRSLVSATVTDRMICDLRPEFVANRREVVFYEHYHLNRPDDRLTVPPSLDLTVRPPPVEEPPTARDDDEQIVLSIPLLAPSQCALLTEGEEITEVDRVLLDTEPGAENVVQKEEDDSTAVMVTKLRLEEHGDQDATQEEVDLANALGVFALDLGDDRTSEEVAATTSQSFKRVEELTPEELQKNVIYSVPRGSVGIQNMMREMSIESGSQPSSLPKAAPISKASVKGSGPKAAPPRSVEA